MIYDIPERSMIIVLRQIDTDISIHPDPRKNTMAQSFR